MVDPLEIKSEIEQLSARRQALWSEIGLRHDAHVAREIDRLSAEIEACWRALRAARTTLRFGSQEGILARARLESRLELERGRTRRGRGVVRTQPVAQRSR